MSDGRPSVEYEVEAISRYDASGVLDEWTDHEVAQLWDGDGAEYILHGDAQLMEHDETGRVDHKQLEKYLAWRFGPEWEDRCDALLEED